MMTTKTRHFLAQLNADFLYLKQATHDFSPEVMVVVHCYFMPA